MKRTEFLYQKMKEELKRAEIEENTPIPQVIIENLNPKLFLRTYQKNAFRYFINYWEKEFVGKPSRHQLLFLMATGSGKTLIIAGLILYLYQQGYRNFLFFVNSRNIVLKTQTNFIDDSSVKYLFNESILIDNKKVNFKEVENFQGISSDSINIVFETIQNLHDKLNNPRENSLTYDDFQGKKVVLISDEAHHINVETKVKPNEEEKKMINSWENTVKKIFSTNPQNVLLEFTATLDLENPLILKKYAERLICYYPLEKFREDFYSKDVEILQDNHFSTFDRALQAVLLSQYRRKVFEKNKKPIKPVVLFKSKKIEESQVFQKEFNKKIKSLTAEKINEIKANSKSEIIEKMFKYFEDNEIILDNLAIELREAFSEEKTISVNSKEESEEKQIIVNTLESPNNGYRAIFAVNKLNEGWDVLNLFDIVRLYDTRDAKSNKPGKTTIQEAQLIGRGMRYCPFEFENLDPEQNFKRKFDSDLQNEMRICETLYYHSANEVKYISELKSVLKREGIIRDNSVKRSLIIKEDLKSTNFWEKGSLFRNERIKKFPRGLNSLPSEMRKEHYQAFFRAGLTFSSSFFEEETEKFLDPQEKFPFLLEKFSSKEVRRKAIDRLISFYSFSNLKKHFPRIKKLDEFILEKRFLGNIQIKVKAFPYQIKNRKPRDELTVALQVFKQISLKLKKEFQEYRGSEEFKQYPINKEIRNKVLLFDNEGLGKPIDTIDLSKKPWYVFNDCYGTSEEKHFVEYIDEMESKILENWDEFYLIRNERFFKLYNFKDGESFEPDYVLFLQSKNEHLYYQVFIEPKGAVWEEKWKQDFLVSLKKEYEVEKLWENGKCIVWGMPFYSKEKEEIFDKKFKEMILVKN